MGKKKRRISGEIKVTDEKREKKFGTDIKTRMTTSISSEEQKIKYRQTNIVSYRTDEKREREKKKKVMMEI